MNFFESLKSRVINLFKKSDLKNIAGEIRVSDKMAEAVNEWLCLFYSKEGVGFAKVLTSYMATLTVNELAVSAGTGKRAEFIEGEIEKYLIPNIRTAVQLAGAGGEIILKPFSDGKNIFSETVSADRFYPTRFNTAGNAEAGFFTDFDTVNGKEVVKLESFDLQPDGYHISHRAFYKKEGGIGAELPLSAVERWKSLPPDIVINGVDRPLFVQIKMPFANTVDPASPLPVSVYAGSTESIKGLDRIYAEFLWEIHTGKRKRIVDRTAVKPHTNDGSGIPFKDRTTDLYLVMDLNAAETKTKPFDDYTPEMRIEAYQRAANIQLRLIEMQCGFSAGTFTFDIRSGKVTATQIISEDKDTYNTIKAVQNGALGQSLKDLVYIYDIYASLYSLAPGGSIDPAVTFGDSIFEDTATEFMRRKAMVDAGLLTKEKFTAWYFGVSEEEAVKSYIPKAKTPDDIMFGEE